MKRIVLGGAAVALLALPAIAAGFGRAPAQVQFILATLHAAALTTARATTDVTDEPYLLVTTLGRGGTVATSPFPTNERMTIRLDEALGARPLTALALEPGDSTRLLITALEGPPSDTHLLGSVLVLVTNEGGSLYWRATECIATCRLLTRPASPELTVSPTTPLGSVAELSGSGGTYHLNLQGQRAQ